MDSRSLIFVLLAACAGPDPSVQDVTAAPSPIPGSTRVAMDIVNHAGKGTIDVHIVLRDEAAGRLIRAAQTVQVQAHETIHFEKDIETPPGTYTVKAAAEYPD